MKSLKLCTCTRASCSHQKWVSFLQILSFHQVLNVVMSPGELRGSEASRSLCSLQGPASPLQGRLDSNPLLPCSELLGVPDTFRGPTGPSLFHLHLCETRFSSDTLTQTADRISLSPDTGGENLGVSQAARPHGGVQTCHPRHSSLGICYYRFPVTELSEVPRFSFLTSKHQ